MIHKREHFLLGTENATISATAKSEINRAALFQHVVSSILVRFREEFGDDALKQLLQTLSENSYDVIDWRLRPEDSCWNQVKHP